MANEDWDDAELEDLFLAFDKVVATDELKASTLRTVRAAQEDRSDLSLGVTRAPRRPMRAHARRMRVVAALSLVLLVVGGAASWLLPVSHVRVEQDGYAVELGVNVYGVTVAATAQGEESQAALAETDVHNMPPEEAERRLRKTFEQVHERTMSDKGGPTSQSKVPRDEQEQQMPMEHVPADGTREPMQVMPDAERSQQPLQQQPMEYPTYNSQAPGQPYNTQPTDQPQGVTQQQQSHEMLGKQEPAEPDGLSQQQTAQPPQQEQAPQQQERIPQQQEQQTQPQEQGFQQQERQPQEEEPPAQAPESQQQDQAPPQQGQQPQTQEWQPQPQEHNQQTSQQEQAPTQQAPQSQHHDAAPRPPRSE